MLLRALVLTWALLICRVTAALANDVDAQVHKHGAPSRIHHLRRQDTNPAPSTTSPPLLQNATTADINAARKVVQDAIARMTKLNKARLENPARNRYTAKPSTAFGKTANAADNPPPPLLEITPEIAQAAALLAEVEAANQTSHPVVDKRARTFWMADIARKGTIPWGNDATYKVFRNVEDYGADRNGKKDSTAAIQKAIDDGKRCGEKCNGSSTKNAIVYFPPGKYLVSSSITISFGTQIIGDANDWPRILASSSFSGLGVLSTDVYVDNGGKGPDGNPLEWYINTARFYSQIRNLRVDITAADPGAYVAAIHYQVAQASSIQNVELIAKTGTNQQGMYSENGSGGVMSDMTFTGGNFGIYGGNQQFSAMRMTFNGCKTAVQVNWDWGWVWKSITINDADVGFRLLNDGGDGNIGSVSFMDSTFSNIKTSAIVMGTPSDKTGSGTTGLILDNVNLGGKIVDNNGKQLLTGGYYRNWVLGPVYKDGRRTWSSGSSMPYAREKTLLGPSVSGLQVNPYYERKRTQYEDKSKDDFVHLKDGGAKGDGTTDDTANIRKTFNQYGDGSKIIFIDSGTYIITDTIVIPKDAKIVGEAWAQFAASGPNFSNSAKPRVMLKIGNDGEEGTVEMQDLILTTKGGTAGVILLEWNVRAKSNGAAALWDVHARIGGAAGTSLTPKECPPITSGTNPSSCQAASLLMHITPKASGYFDNMWLWVADHMIDDADLNSATNDMPQLSVYSARGLLVESQAATWLYGTASEHNVYYQYNFHNAQNIFTTMIQTESPYFQPTPKPPDPFKGVAQKMAGDPNYDCKGGDFDGCDASWAVIMEGSQNIYVGGVGTYSWFSTYTQDCIDEHTCQKTLWLLNNNYDNNRLQHIISIGAKNILAVDGKGVAAKDNLAITGHPAWSQISIFEIPSKGKAPTDDPNDKCLETDRMYSTEQMPDGKYFNWNSLDPKVIANPDEQYITIVNLTPYKFVKTSEHEYQFPIWNFGDIPSGKSRQNTLQYGGGDETTTNGEVYYSIEGTDKKFVVRGTTHIPDPYPLRTVFDLTGMGLGQREYGDPARTTPVTLVITGSEQYGYISSLTFQPCNWMHNIYDTIKDRELRHIVMPGSHDGGMTKINSVWNGGGSKADTQTQGLSMYDQLRVGSRYWDLRIVRLDKNDFYVAHVKTETDQPPLGASGSSLKDLIADVNKFMDEYPGEIIVWYIKYLVNFYTAGFLLGKDSPSDEIFWDRETMIDFFEALRGIKYRCLNLKLDNDSTLDQQLARTYMDQNGGKGCVLLITDHKNIRDGVPDADVDTGIYSQASINRDDFWPNKQVTRENAEAQVAHLTSRRRDGGDADQLNIMQWQCTPDHLDSVSWGLDAIAVKSDNPALYWKGINYTSPEYFPTVILEDYIGQLHKPELTDEDVTSFPEKLGAEIQTVVIGLNLYMVSQNCNVSHRRHPLLKKPAATKGLFASTGADTPTSAADSVDAFTGIIYANGTVDNDPPPNFHLGRVKILKAGTDFGNGTVLAVDMLNPDYDAPTTVGGGN